MNTKHEERTITKAIETYPMEPLPEGFLKHVMSKISPRPEFDPEWLVDPNTRFLFTVIPWAILGLGISVSLLFGFRSLILGPSQASYVRSLVDYWILRITYSTIQFESITLIAVTALILVGFMFLWRMLDPKKAH